MERVIEVSPAQMERLSGQFRAVWHRPPTEAELAGLVDNFVREEIYYREALALGLDRDDTIIRRRLQQKMEFLSDAGAGALAPNEAELKAYFAKHVERFTPAARITFRQVFVGDLEPAAILARLAAGADPQEFGQGTLLPPAMEASPSSAVDGIFGAGFFAAVAKLEPGMWSGPVNSAFGQHLVEVLEIERPTPQFEAVRNVVEQDWRREAAEALREARYRLLRDRYEIVMPSTPERG